MSKAHHTLVRGSLNNVASVTCKIKEMVYVTVTNNNVA